MLGRSVLENINSAQVLATGSPPVVVVLFADL